MSKGVKRMLGVVASIAIPFAAPAIAGSLATGALANTALGGFMAGAGGSALTGAVLGGAASALTGGDALTGALTGGLGGFAGAGGFSGMFGPAQASSTGAVSGPMASSVRPVARPVGLGAPAAAATSAAAGTGLSGAGAAGAPTTAGGAAGAGSVLQSGLSALTDPQTLARITLMAATGQTDGLSSAEKRLVRQRKRELAEMAATDREVFEQQVDAAQRLMQMAEQQAPNPQQAFAATKIATERQLSEQTRGLGDEEAAFARRRAGIRGTQAGATAAAAEETRGRQSQTQMMQAGLRSLPTSVPEGYAGRALPLYQDLAERKRQAEADLAYKITSAAPGLFGTIA